MDNNANQPNNQQAAPPAKEPPKKKKGTAGKIVKAIIWILVVAVVIGLVLFLSMKIGEFETLGDMFAFIRSSM